MKIYYIYLTTNLINGKTYVGQHYGKLNDGYLGSGTLITNSIKCHGKCNFKKDILAVCNSKDELNILEIEYIRMYREIGKAEYNISKGGELSTQGVPCSEHTKELLRNAQKLYWSQENMSEIHSNRIKSERYYNSIHSEEYSRLKSEEITNRWKNPNYRERIKNSLKGKNIGKVRTKEMREATSVAMRNSKVFLEKMASQEHREKLSNSLRNSDAFQKSRKSEEFKLKMSQLNKGRRQYTLPTGEHKMLKPEQVYDGCVKGWI